MLSTFTGYYFINIYFFSGSITFTDSIIFLVGYWTITCGDGTLIIYGGAWIVTGRIYVWGLWCTMGAGICWIIGCVYTTLGLIGWVFKAFVWRFVTNTWSV